MALSFPHLRSHPFPSRFALPRHISTSLQVHREISLREENLISVNPRFEPVNLRAEQPSDIDLPSETLASIVATDDSGRHGFGEVYSERWPLAPGHGTSAVRQAIALHSEIGVNDGPVQPNLQSFMSSSALGPQQVSQMPTPVTESKDSNIEVSHSAYKHTLASRFVVGLSAAGVVYGLGVIATRFPTPIVSSLMAKVVPSLPRLVISHVGSIASGGLRSIGALYMNATNAVCSRPIASCLYSILSGCALGAWASAGSFISGGQARISSIDQFRHSNFNMLIQRAMIFSESWWTRV